MSELLDIYDENKQKTRKIIDREEVENLNKNEYIISVHCWIINSSREILITQRSLNKKRGGKWEDTHGAVQTGETSIIGMQRELKEELGIDIKEDELKLITTDKSDNKFKDFYAVAKDIKIEDIYFNDGEVMDCKYVTIGELKKMIENGECSFSSFEDTIFYNHEVDYFLQKK